MSEGPTTSPFGGLLLILCPLLCLALPPLLVAGIGAVLTVEVGLVFAGVTLASLVVAGFLVVRRKRSRELCCSPPEHARAPERPATPDRSLVEATRR